MRRICTHISISLLCLSTASMSGAGPDVSADWLKTPFYKVVKNRNKMAIETNTLPHMKELDNAENVMQAASRGDAEIPSRLNDAKGNEAGIVDSVKSVIQYRKVHNSRLDGWGSDVDDACYSEFLRSLRVTAKMIEKIRNDNNLQSPWQYVAVHWYPNAMVNGLHEDAIPRDAFDLVPSQWRDANQSLQVYAFFSFLRKTCEIPEVRVFLDGETGWMTFWQTPTQTYRISRPFDPEYYAYQYVSWSDTPQDGSPLCERVLSITTLDPAVKSVGAFYMRKLSFFRTLVEEAIRPESAAFEGKPYRDLYRYTCRSLPCISAFRSGRAAPNTDLRWVAGYTGEQPAAGRLNPESPVGLAYKLAAQIPAFSFTDTLQPILLVQADWIPADTQDRSDFSYEPSKVGFKGYIDLLRRDAK